VIVLSRDIATTRAGLLITRLERLRQGQNS
jgi:hypothetical protein